MLVKNTNNGTTKVNTLKIQIVTILTAIVSRSKRIEPAIKIACGN